MCLELGMESTAEEQRSLETLDLADHPPLGLCDLSGQDGLSFPFLNIRTLLNAPLNWSSCWRALDVQMETKLATDQTSLPLGSGTHFKMPLYQQLNKNTSSTGMREHGINMSSPPIVLQSLNLPMIDCKRQLQRKLFECAELKTNSEAFRDEQS